VCACSSHATVILLNNKIWQSPLLTESPSSVDWSILKNVILRKWGIFFSLFSNEPAERPFI
jgi:hypothetical protein